jgi:uncharacterized protein
MKNIFVSLALLVQICQQANAQNAATPINKTITVTGTAEITIPATEVELEIELKEIEEPKKLDINKVEKEFVNVLTTHKIDVKNITLSEVDSYGWYRWWHQRNNNLKHKWIKIKLTQATNILKLVKDLNKKWVEAIRIVNTKNENAMAYRKQVKLEAIKAAKEKAKYLLEGIGEQLGAVQTIEEEDDTYNSWFRNNNVLSNTALQYSATSNNEAGVDNVEGITLRYKIKTVFTIL